jgi:ABC-type glycerol-3-phosphate transport system permease component
MRSQVSVEYLIVIGIALVLLFPLLYLFYRSSTDSQNIANSNMIVVAGDKITSNADKIFYQSENSKLSLDISLPNNVFNVTTGADNKTLIFTASYEGESTDYLFSTTVPIFIGECNAQDPAGSLALAHGKNTVVVHSCGKNVSIYAS